MSICIVRGTKAWYKIEAVMRDTGEKVVIDDIDLYPPPMELAGGGYFYHKKGVRGEIKGYSELDLYVVSVSEEKGCEGCKNSLDTKGAK